MPGTNKANNMQSCSVICREQNFVVIFQLSVTLTCIQALIWPKTKFKFPLEKAWCARCNREKEIEHTAVFIETLLNGCTS